jgi:hypothetical protein
LSLCKKAMTKKKIIGIVQPTYLPWLPFFERMAVSDIFVILDDVQYSKNSNFNRNNIKSQNGRLLLTVPVSYKGKSTATIREIEVGADGKWQNKHWRTISQLYARAPFWDRYRDQIESLLLSPKEKLIDVVLPVVNFLKTEFQISTPIKLSSEIPSWNQGNKKLVDICKHFGGTHFVVRPGSDDYHPGNEFSPFQINFAHLTYSSITYPQLHGEFEENLSALDYLLNCGPGHPPFTNSLKLDSAG